MAWVGWGFLAGYPPSINIPKPCSLSKAWGAPQAYKRSAELDLSLTPSANLPPACRPGTQHRQLYRVLHCDTRAFICKCVLLLTNTEDSHIRVSLLPTSNSVNPNRRVRTFYKKVERKSGKEDRERESETEVLCFMPWSSDKSVLSLTLTCTST